VIATICRGINYLPVVTGVIFTILNGRRLSGGGRKRMPRDDSRNKVHKLDWI